MDFGLGTISIQVNLDYATSLEQLYRDVKTVYIPVDTAARQEVVALKNELKSLPSVQLAVDRSNITAARVEVNKLRVELFSLPQQVAIGVNTNIASVLGDISTLNSTLDRLENSRQDINIKIKGIDDSLKKVIELNKQLDQIKNGGTLLRIEINPNEQKFEKMFERFTDRFFSKKLETKQSGGLVGSLARGFVEGVGQTAAKPFTKAALGVNGEEALKSAGKYTGARVEDLGKKYFSDISEIFGYSNPQELKNDIKRFRNFAFEYIDIKPAIVRATRVLSEINIDTNVKGVSMGEAIKKQYSLLSVEFQKKTEELVAEITTKALRATYTISSPAFKIRKDELAARGAQNYTPQTQMGYQGSNNVILTVPGLYHQGGEGGKEIKRYLEPFTSPDTEIIPIKNTFEDTSVEATQLKNDTLAFIKNFEDATRFLPMVSNKLKEIRETLAKSNYFTIDQAKMISNEITAISSTAIQGADTVQTILEKNPQAKISLVGHSYGGKSVEDILKILEQRGIKLPGDALGLGTPYPQTFIDTPIDGLTQVMGERDPYGFFQKTIDPRALEDVSKLIRKRMSEGFNLPKGETNDNIEFVINMIKKALPHFVTPKGGNITLSKHGDMHQLEYYLADPAVLSVLEKYGVNYMQSPLLEPQTGEKGQETISKAANSIVTANDFLMGDGYLGELKQNIDLIKKTEREIVGLNQELTKELFTGDLWFNESEITRIEKEIKEAQSQLTEFKISYENIVDTKFTPNPKISFFSRKGFTDRNAVEQIKEAIKTLETFYLSVKSLDINQDGKEIKNSLDAYYLTLSELQSQFVAGKKVPDNYVNPMVLQKDKPSVELSQQPQELAERANNEKLKTQLQSLGNVAKDIAIKTPGISVVAVQNAITFMASVIDAGAETRKVVNNVIEVSVKTQNQIKNALVQLSVSPTGQLIEQLSLLISDKAVKDIETTKLAVNNLLKRTAEGLKSYRDNNSYIDVDAQQIYEELKGTDSRVRQLPPATYKLPAAPSMNQLGDASLMGGNITLALPPTVVLEQQLQVLKQEVITLKQLAQQAKDYGDFLNIAVRASDRLKETQNKAYQAFKEANNPELFAELNLVKTGLGHSKRQALAQIFDDRQFLAAAAEQGEQGAIALINAFYEALPRLAESKRNNARRMLDEMEQLFNSFGADETVLTTPLSKASNITDLKKEFERIRRDVARDAGIADIPVNLETGYKGIAQYDNAIKSVKINLDTILAQTPEQIQRIFAHEIRHAVQYQFPQAIKPLVPRQQFNPKTAEKIEGWAEQSVAVKLERVKELYPDISEERLKRIERDSRMRERDAYTYDMLYTQQQRANRAAQQDDTILVDLQQYAEAAARSITNNAATVTKAAVKAGESVAQGLNSTYQAINQTAKYISKPPYPQAAQTLITAAGQGVKAAVTPTVQQLGQQVSNITPSINQQSGAQAAQTVIGAVQSGVQMLQQSNITQPYMQLLGASGQFTRGFVGQVIQSTGAVRILKNTVSGLFDLFLGGAGLYGAFFFFQTFGMESLRANISLETFQDNLDSLQFGSAPIIERQIESLAKKLQTDLGQLRKSYFEFAQAGQQYFSQNVLDDTFAGITRGTNRLDPQNQERVFLALTQILNKQKVQAQELVIQYGQAFPAGLEVLSRALGTTIEKLFTLGKTGEVSANDVVAALGAEMQKLKPQLDTTQNYLNLFNNATLQIKENFGGILKVGIAVVIPFGKLLSDLAENQTALNLATGVLFLGAIQLSLFGLGKLSGVIIGLVGNFVMLPPKITLAKLALMGLNYGVTNFIPLAKAAGLAALGFVKALVIPAAVIGSIGALTEYFTRQREGIEGGSKALDDYIKKLNKIDELNKRPIEDPAGIKYKAKGFFGGIDDEYFNFLSRLTTGKNLPFESTQASIEIKNRLKITDELMAKSRGRLAQNDIFNANFDPSPLKGLLDKRTALDGQLLAAKQLGDTEKIIGYQNQLKQINSQILDTKKAISGVDEEILILTRDQLKAELKSLETLVAESPYEIPGVNAKMAELNRQLNQANAAISLFDQKTRTVQLSVQNLDFSFGSFTASITEAAERIDQLKISRDIKTEALRFTAGTQAVQMGELSNKLADTQTRLGIIPNQIQKLNEIINRLAPEELIRLNSAAEGLGVNSITNATTTDLDVLSKTFTDGNISVALQAKKKIIELQNSAGQLQLEQVKTQNEIVEQNFQFARAQNNFYIGQLEAARKRTQAYNDQLIALQNQFEQIQDEMSASVKSLDIQNKKNEFLRAMNNGAGGIFETIFNSIIKILDDADQTVQEELDAKNKDRVLQEAIRKSTEDLNRQRLDAIEELRQQREQIEDENRKLKGSFIEQSNGANNIVPFTPQTRSDVLKQYPELSKLTPDAIQSFLNSSAGKEFKNSADPEILRAIRDVTEIAKQNALTIQNNIVPITRGTGQLSLPQLPDPVQNSYKLQGEYQKEKLYGYSWDTQGNRSPIGETGLRNLTDKIYSTNGVLKVQIVDIVPSVGNITAPSNSNITPLSVPVAPNWKGQGVLPIPPQGGGDLIDGGKGGDTLAKQGYELSQLQTRLNRMRVNFKDNKSRKMRDLYPQTNVQNNPYNSSRDSYSTYGSPYGTWEENNSGEIIPSTLIQYGRMRVIDHKPKKGYGNQTNIKGSPYGSWEETKKNYELDQEEKKNIIKQNKKIQNVVKPEKLPAFIQLDKINFADNPNALQYGSIGGKQIPLIDTQLTELGTLTERQNSQLTEQRSLEAQKLSAKQLARQYVQQAESAKLQKTIRKQLDDDYLETIDPQGRQRSSLESLGLAEGFLPERSSIPVEAIRKELELKREIRDLQDEMVLGEKLLILLRENPALEKTLGVTEQQQQQLLKNKVVTEQILNRDLALVSSSKDKLQSQKALNIEQEKQTKQLEAQQTLLQSRSNLLGARVTAKQNNLFSFEFDVAAMNRQKAVFDEQIRYQKESLELQQLAQRVNNGQEKYISIEQVNEQMANALEAHKLQLEGVKSQYKDIRSTINESFKVEGKNLLDSVPDFIMGKKSFNETLRGSIDNLINSTWKIGSSWIFSQLGSMFKPKGKGLPEGQMPDKPKGFLESISSVFGLGKPIDKDAVTGMKESSDCCCQLIKQMMGSNITSDLSSPLGALTEGFNLTESLDSLFGTSASIGSPISSLGIDNVGLGDGTGFFSTSILQSAGDTLSGSFLEGVGSQEGVSAFQSVFKGLSQAAGGLSKILKGEATAEDWMSTLLGIGQTVMGSMGGGVPAFDTGGVVPGTIGEAKLAIVHAGETILPTHKDPKMLNRFSKDGKMFSEEKQSQSIVIETQMINGVEYATKEQVYEVAQRVSDSKVNGLRNKIRNSQQTRTNLGIR